MSRGGTRKARARQQAERRARARQAPSAKASARSRRKPSKRRKGKGRAALLHLSGAFAPLLLALGLRMSGMASTETGAYWIGMFEDPNASYFSELGGLVYAAAVLSASALVFLLLPVGLWRRMYRTEDPLFKDLTSVDGPFTLMVIIGFIWLLRMVAGFSDATAGFAIIMSLLALYVPVFSALLALTMPVVPGSGRIGGILPGFLRVKVAERFLLSDADRERMARYTSHPEEFDLEE